MDQGGPRKGEGNRRGDRVGRKGREERSDARKDKPTVYSPNLKS